MKPLILPASLPSNISESEQHWYRKSRQKYFFALVICAPIFASLATIAVAALIIDGPQGYGIAAVMAFLAVLPFLVWIGVRKDAVDNFTALQRISSVRRSAGFVDTPPLYELLNDSGPITTKLAGILSDIEVRDQYVAALYQKMRDIAAENNGGINGHFKFSYEYLIKHAVVDKDLVQALFEMSVFARRARGVETLDVRCYGADMAVYLAFCSLLDANHSDGN